MKDTEALTINRAPVLTLWAVVVGEHLGFDHDEALTLGCSTPSFLDVIRVLDRRLPGKHKFWILSKSLRLQGLPSPSAGGWNCFPDLSKLEGFPSTAGKNGRGSEAARDLGVARRKIHHAFKVSKLTPDANKAAQRAGLDDNQSALLAAAVHTCTVLAGAADLCLILLEVVSW